MVKALARKSSKTVALEALKDESIKRHILKNICMELAEEIRNMASDKVQSTLQSQKVNDVKEFRWDTLLTELTKHAPVLKTILKAATKSRKPRVNTDAVIGMFAAILLCHRNSKMNLVQKIISLILYCGHTSKQVCMRDYFVHFKSCYCRYTINCRD